MKLQFYGTAAAEGIPSLYCQCETCKTAFLRGGRNIRTRSQALVDDTILIDFGPDTFAHMIYQRLPLDTLHHVLITHKHSDHFYCNDLLFRRKGYASKVEAEPLHVYGCKPVYDKVSELINQEENMTTYLLAHEVHPLETFNIQDYQITPLKANHDSKAGAVIYYIKHKDKSMLYAHDTGYFFEETWKYLENIEKPLDLLTLDCTAGLLTGWKDHHLSFDCFLMVVEEMKKRKIIDEHTKIIANHFSHNGHANYEEMAVEAKKHNVDVSYDSMIVEF